MDTHAQQIDSSASEAPIRLKQGDLRLLETEVAARLLSAAIPARFAYLALDGSPRVLPTWFHWTGELLTMPTFVAAPHVRHPARRLEALKQHPEVAVTIDTERFPPEVLTIRGKAAVTVVDGIPEEYALSAERYLGADAAREYLAQIDQPGTRMARIDVRPAWVGLLDFQTRLPSALGGIT
jgi:hypothetical protein